MKPFHRRLLKIFSIVIVGFLCLFFIFRNPLLHWITGKITDKIKARTGATLAFKDSHFSGFTTVQLEHTSLVPVYGDTIFTAENIEARVSVWTLLMGTIRLKELHALNVNVNISCREGVCNYESFLRQKTVFTNVAMKSSGKNYAVLARQLLDQVFNLTPQKATLTNVALNYRNDYFSRSVVLENFSSDVNSLLGNVIDKNSGATWRITGAFSQTKHTLSMTVYSGMADHNPLPLLKELTGTTLTFDTMSLGLSGYSMSGNEEIAKGQFSVKGFSLQHARISDDTVKIASASFNFSAHAGSDYIEIDSTSKASLGNITLMPFVRFESGRSKKYALKIKTDNIPSTDFFSSLPAGMFDEVREIEADGTLRFSLDFSIDSEKPDLVVFETSMKKEKFRIRKFGNSNLMKMNGEFVQNVYERGRLVRSFPVGESNPAYTPLYAISPNFINSVLTSEDGSFFYHNGFNEDAFRKSIAVNFKEGKFKRGGSTISMQLVKNVFLTRKKTVARKAEEALLVWLIENNRLYSKERMLEVYMNIIELGPGVYGIGEATPFYFKKTPAELTLPESIFLASLLPHPKWFKYSFDTLGNLKPYLADYYRIVSDFMLRKELITQQQHDELQPNVTLLGPAKEMVMPSDTLPKDEDEDLN